MLNSNELLQSDISLKIVKKYCKWARWDENLLYKSEKIKKSVSRRRRTDAASELKLTGDGANLVDELSSDWEIRFTYTNTISPTSYLYPIYIHADGMIIYYFRLFLYHLHCMKSNQRLIFFSSYTCIHYITSYHNQMLLNAEKRRSKHKKWYSCVVNLHIRTARTYNLRFGYI